MSLATLDWNWSAPTLTRGILLPHVFEVWHRGKNLGMRLEDLRLDGYPVGAPALERLNYWLEADGAWRASLLPHFESEKVLSTVLRRHRTLTLGEAGGGRWASGTTAEEILRNSRKGVQTMLRLEI